MTFACMAIETAEKSLPYPFHISSLEIITFLIKVKVSAAAILSHLASGGESSWVLGSPSHGDVLTPIYNGLKTVDEDGVLHMGISTYADTLKLLKLSDYPELQFFAAFEVFLTFKDEKLSLTGMDGSVLMMVCSNLSPFTLQRVISS